jgi:hypothetical protein
MRTVFAGLSLALALWMPARALAWNHKGHLVVAYLAYQELTPPEKASVAQLVRTHPDLQTFSLLAGSPRSSSYRMLVFMHAARWPDLIRDDPRFYDETDPHARPTKLLRNFPDMQRHKPWHFKDEGFSPDGTRVDEPEEVNAEAAIGALRQVLGDPSQPAPHRAYALAWLEHLVGDVHQPLHCVSRYTQGHPRGDRGGNLFVIAPFHIPGVSFEVENLHSFWDGVLGGETTLAAVRAVAREAQASSPAEPMDDPKEATWIKESFEHAQSAAYGPLVGQPGRPQLSPDYFAAARALALARLKLAGHRLAALIRDALK